MGRAGERARGWVVASGLGGMPPGRARFVLGGAIEGCLACGSARVEAVTREVDAKYRCPDCGRCWTCVFSGVYRVNPVECPGCAHRDTCFEQLREDFAGWWSLPGLAPAGVPAAVDDEGAADGGGGSHERASERTLDPARVRVVRPR